MYFSGKRDPMLLILSRAPWKRQWFLLTAGPVRAQPHHQILCALLQADAAAVQDEEACWYSLWWPFYFHLLENVVVDHLRRRCL